jgi:hypothetical protein
VLRASEGIPTPPERPHSIQKRRPRRCEGWAGQILAERRPQAGSQIREDHLSDHKFKLGQLVRYTPDRWGRASDVYKLLPPEGDKPQYRIKSENELMSASSRSPCLRAWPDDSGIVRLPLHWCDERTHPRHPSILRKPENPRAHVFLHNNPKGAFTWMLFSLNANGVAKTFEQRSQCGDIRPEIFIDTYFGHPHPALGLR